MTKSIEIPTHYDELTKFHQSILVHTLKLVIDHLLDDNKQVLEKFGDSSKLDKLNETIRLLKFAIEETEKLNKLLDETRLELLRKNPEKCLEYKLDELPEEFKQLWLYLKKKQDKEFANIIKEALKQRDNMLRIIQESYIVPDEYFINDNRSWIKIRPIC